jgi:hypothetical protein
MFNNIPAFYPSHISSIHAVPPTITTKMSPDFILMGLKSFLIEKKLKGNASLMYQLLCHQKQTLRQGIGYK